MFTFQPVSASEQASVTTHLGEPLTPNWSARSSVPAGGNAQFMWPAPYTSTPGHWSAVSGKVY